MAYRSIGAAKKNAGSGNLASVGLPAGHAANDILVLVVTAADNVVCSVDQSYTSKLLTNGTTSARQEIWWKRDTGSEVAPTVTHAAGNSAVAFILAFSGCATTGDPFSQASAQNNNGSATVTAPTITPGNNEDCVFVGSACSNTDTSGAPVTQASYSGTNPTYTERGDAEESTGSKEANLAIATGTSNGTSTGARTSATTSGFAASALDNIGAQFSLLQATAAAGGLALARIPNRMVGPMALRYRFRQPERFGYPAGPQTFLQELDATSGTTASFQLQVNKILSATEGSTASLQKQVNKLLSIAAAPSSATIKRQANKLLTVSGATTASIQRQVNKILSVPGSTAVSIVKTVTKTLSTSVSSTATLNAVFQAASTAVARLRTMMGVGQ